MPLLKEMVGEYNNLPRDLYMPAIYSHQPRQMMWLAVSEVQTIRYFLHFVRKMWCRRCRTAIFSVYLWEIIPIKLI